MYSIEIMTGEYGYVAGIGFSDEDGDMTIAWVKDVYGEWLNFDTIAGDGGAMQAVDGLAISMGLPVIHTVNLDGLSLMGADAISRSLYEN